MFQMKSNTILQDTHFARLCQFRSAYCVFEDKVAPHAQQLSVPTVLAILSPAQPLPDKISLGICQLKPAPLLLCTHNNVWEDTAGRETAIPGSPAPTIP
jgi:hypothetical protein